MMNMLKIAFLIDLTNENCFEKNPWQKDRPDNFLLSQKDTSYGSFEGIA